MLTSELLSRLRTLLDESTEETWLDSECYGALTAGQLEIVKVLWKKFQAEAKLNPYLEIPQVLRPLVTSTTDTFAGTTQALPALFYDIISIKGSPAPGGTLIPLKKRPENFDKYKVMDNPYLQSSPVGIGNTDIFYSIVPPNFVFETGFGGGSIAYDYLKTPLAIALAVEPGIGADAHEALLYFAFAFLLNKVKLPNVEYLNYFDKLVSAL